MVAREMVMRSHARCQPLVSALASRPRASRPRRSARICSLTASARAAGIQLLMLQRDYRQLCSLTKTVSLLGARPGVPSNVLTRRALSTPGMTTSVFDDGAGPA